MSAHKCGADGVRDTEGSGGDDGEPWLAVAVVMKTDVSGGGGETNGNGLDDWMGGRGAADPVPDDCPL